MNLFTGMIVVVPMRQMVMGRIEDTEASNLWFSKGIYEPCSFKGDSQNPRGQKKQAAYVFQ